MQEGAAALLVDVAGPTRLVVEGIDLEGLARGWQLAQVGEQVAWVRDVDPTPDPAPDPTRDPGAGSGPGPGSDAP